tara:strand:+ start:376 stop:537 length:162 start_codon:yes stop_codon:yes gene_type:complete
MSSGALFEIGYHYLDFLGTFRSPLLGHFFFFITAWDTFSENGWMEIPGAARFF